MQSNIDEAKRQFANYLQKRKIRWSAQREQVLDVFLKTEGHPTLDQFYRIVSEHHSNISYATVYRAMKVICDSGIGEGITFSDKTTRYEHAFGHEPHDHLVCIDCGELTEFQNSEVEAIKNQVSKNNEFEPLRHKLLIYGYCILCRKKNQ